MGHTKGHPWLVEKCGLILPSSKFNDYHLDKAGEEKGENGEEDGEVNVHQVASGEEECRGDE